MKKTLKKLSYIYFIFLLILTIFTIVYTLLIYFNKVEVDFKSFNITTFIMGIILFFLLGLISGNTAQKNGLLEGMLAALFIILFVLIVNLIVQNEFTFKTFIKTITYLLSSSLGGVLGVNFRPIKKIE